MMAKFNADAGAVLAILVTQSRPGSRVRIFVHPCKHDVEDSRLESGKGSCKLHSMRMESSHPLHDVQGQLSCQAGRNGFVRTVHFQNAVTVVRLKGLGWK